MISEKEDSHQRLVHSRQKINLYIVVCLIALNKRVAYFLYRQNKIWRKSNNSADFT